MNGKPAARLGDGVSKGVIVQGSRTVLIGSQGGVACSACPAGVAVGHPVNPQLGAKVLSGPEDLDFALPGAMPLVWQRQYSSYVNAEHGGYCGPFGYGWGVPLQLRLTVRPTTTLLHDSQGRTITFEALEPGQSLYSPSEDIWLLRGGLQAGSLVQELPGLGTAHLLEQLQHNPATPAQKQPIQEQHMPQWLQGRFAWVHPELARKRHLILAASGQGDTLWIFAPQNWQALEAASHQQTTAPEPDVEWLLIGKIDRLGRQQHYRWQDILGARRLERITDGSGRCYQLHYQQVCAAQAERNYPHSGKNYRWLADSGVRLTHIDLIADPTRGEQPELVQPITLVRYGYSVQGDLVQVQDRHKRITRRYAWQEHLLVMHQHQSGPEHHYEYDRYAPGGLAVRQRNPGALDYQFDYQSLPDQAGKPRKACLVSDSLGRQKTYIFEGEAGLERLVEQRQADGSTLSYTYNAWGHRTSTTDPLGRTSRQQISPTGQLLAAISADGARSSLTYDDDTDLLLASTDAQGRTTRYSYDSYHRLISVTQADGSSEHYEYPDPQSAAAHALQRINADKPHCIIDAQGGRKHLTYTASGQLASYSDCSGHTTTYTYTRWGQPSSVTNALGELTRYHYNEQEQLSSVRYPDGSTEHYHYNEQGQLTHVQAQGPEGASSDTDADVYMVYDDQGRIKERRHAGQALHFAYDAAGRITTLTNENAEHTRFSWDVMDRLVQEVGFDARVQSYQYDAAGQLIAASDGWQQEQGSPAHTQRYEWSATGLLAARYLPASANTPASVHRYEWNQAAELIQASVWHQTPNAEQLQSQALIERDNAGRVSSEVQRLYRSSTKPSAEPEIEFEHRIAHRINAMGQRQASSLQGLGDIEFLLYGPGYLHGVSWQGQSLLDIERDALQRETLRRLHTTQQAAEQTAERMAPTPLLRQLSWDRAGRLHAMRYQGLGMPSTPQAAASPTFGQLHPAEITGQLSARHYHYDSLGQMVGIQTPQGMSEFAYDAAGRLTQATSPHAGQQRWRFDAAGNRLPITDAASALQGPQRRKHQDLIVNPEQLERHDFNAFGEVDTAAEGKPQPQHYWAGNRVLHYSNSEDPSAQGLLYSYDYDSRGNRIRSSERYAHESAKSNAPSRSLALDYDSGNQLVQVQLQEQAGTIQRQCTQRYRYDALGRRLAAYRSVHNANGTTEHSADYFGWDGDRLVHTERYQAPDTPPEIIHTIYEPGTFTPLIQLRRNAKAAPDVVEALIAQAPAGMVQDELRAMLSDLSATQALMSQSQGANSQAVKELQQLQALQQAQHKERNQSTEVRYYLCDHLGTPNALINQSGDIAWAAQLDAWGQVVKEYNPHNLYQPIRLPGQHQDPDTGLYYNRHRYYEPRLGRYINQDPIGLLGGVNLNVYPLNPLDLIDSLGLQQGCVVRFPDYPIEYSEGKTSTWLGGHAGVLIYDSNGKTKYYEYGRYHPSSSGVFGAKLSHDDGNVRSIPVPDLKIGNDGKPTEESMENLKSKLSKSVGKNTSVALTCSSVDTGKVKSFVKDIAENKDRDKYRWNPFFPNHCRSFAYKAIKSGK